MNCPTCGAPTEVLETRATKTKGTRRMRQCDHGHRFPTYEVAEVPVQPLVLNRAWTFENRPNA